MNVSQHKAKAVNDFLTYIHNTPQVDPIQVVSNARTLLVKWDKKPMPSWKKKTYAMGLGLATVWLLVQYMHYETCREKYPQASSWVCMVSPK